MKISAYVDMNRAKADGTYPVYVIVVNKNGRFFVNTGMTTCDRLTGGRVFPKKDKSGSYKTTLLGKYLANIELLCVQHDLSGGDNSALKAAIKRDVFGVEDNSRRDKLAEYIAKFAETKRKATASLYGITERKVRSFAPDATLSKINAGWLESYRKWCIDSGMKVNGAAKELRNIRAVFNWCIRKGVTTNYPFDDYSIPEEESVPNNISVEDLRMLRDYPCEDWQRQYKDFFFLSFYLAGINPGDLLLLRREALKDGHISFIRRKTNKQGAKKIRQIVLPVVDEAMKIIKKYPSKEGYLVGFMDGRNDYHSFSHACTEALKKIGEKEVVEDKVGKRRKIVYHPLFPDITLYTARYSFGSIAANDLDISEQTIGQCLGHSWSKRVTSRYISHDQRKIDNAVRRVAEYLEAE